MNLSTGPVFGGAKLSTMANRLNRPKQTSEAFTLSQPDRFELTRRAGTHFLGLHAKQLTQTEMDRFFSAAATGDRATFSDILQKGKNPNLESENGHTALMVAALFRQVAIVKHLLGNGNTILNGEDNQGRNVLHLAAEGGNPEILELLMESVLDKSDLLNRPDHAGHTPLMVAASSGHPNAVEMLLKHHADLTLRDYSGHSALGYAAIAGNAPSVQALVNRYRWLDKHSALEKDLAYRDHCGKDALTHAVFSGDADKVALLLQAGARQDWQDAEAQTAVHIAAAQGNTAMLEQLLNFGGNVNAINIIGQTPLMAAAGGGHAAAVSLLLDKGALPQAINAHGQTAFQYAAAARSFSVINILVRRSAATTGWHNPLPFFSAEGPPGKKRKFPPAE